MSDPTPIIEWLFDYTKADQKLVNQLAAAGHFALFERGEGHWEFQFRWPGLTRAVKIRLPFTKDFSWDGDGPKPALWPLGDLAETLVVVEGEFDCLALTALGFVPGRDVVSVTFGAGTPPPDGLGQALCQRGVRTVILAFDADPAGRKGAMAWAEALGAKLRVGILDLAPLLDRLVGEKDVRDVVRRRAEAGDLPALKAELDRLLAEAIDLASEPERDEMLPADQIEPRDPEALWGGLLYAGEVTVIAGNPGVGKSFLLQKMAADLALHGTFAGRGPGEPVAAVILTSELSPAAVAARVERLVGCRPARLHIMGAADLWDQSEFSRLVRDIRRLGARLLVLDTLEGFLPADENKAPEALRQMRRLQSLARLTQAAVVALAHLRKPPEAAIDDVLLLRGSTMRAAKAAVVALLRAEGEVRKLVVVKSWYARPVGLVFELTEAGQLLVHGEPERGPDSAADQALAFIRQRGEVTRAEVVAGLSGYSARAVDAALDRLVERGLVRRLRFGRYAPANYANSANFANSAPGGNFAEFADFEAGDMKGCKVSPPPEPAPQPADQPRAAEPAAGEPPDQPAQTAGLPFRIIIDSSLLAPLPDWACCRCCGEPVDWLERLEQPTGTRWLVQCPVCGRQDLRLETAAVARLVAELELEVLSG